MPDIPQALAFSLIVACLSACAPAAPPADAASPESQGKSPAQEPLTEEPHHESAPLPHSARLVERTQAGRAAEIVDVEGVVLETLVPEDFAQTLKVPDIVGNSSAMITRRVAGTDIVAVSVEEGTGRVLLAVRGFAYAEVGTDLLFLLAPPEPGNGPRSASTIQPIYFDGPNAVDEEGAARPQFDITHVSFGSGGSLEVATADASGGSCRLVYDSEGTPQLCAWSGGESRRCPRGIEPQ